MNSKMFILRLAGTVLLLVITSELSHPFNLAAIFPWNFGYMSNSNLAFRPAPIISRGPMMVRPPPVYVRRVDSGPSTDSYPASMNGPVRYITPVPTNNYRWSPNSPSVSSASDRSSLLSSRPSGESPGSRSGVSTDSSNNSFMRPSSSRSGNSFNPALAAQPGIHRPLAAAPVLISRNRPLGESSTFDASPGAISDADIGFEAPVNDGSVGLTSGSPPSDSSSLAAPSGSSTAELNSSPVSVSNLPSP